MEEPKIKSVKITTRAKPRPESLLAARAAIKARSELQDLFEKARNEKWTSEGLADALFVNLTEYLIDTEDLWDTALYLTDEFTQLGDDKDHVFLIARETGQAICKVSHKNIYIPVPVKRESGAVVQPLPRLRPELEGLIVQWQFEKSQNERILKTLASRIPQTMLQKQEGDNRLLRATRTGRKKIADMLREDLPTLFFSQHAGIIDDFLRLLHFCAPSETVPPEFDQHKQTTIRATVITPITDPLTFNLRHDPYTSLKQKIVAQWIRCIAQSLSELSYETIDALITDSLPTGFWLAAPNVAIMLQGRKVIPISGIKSLLLRETPIAYFCIDPASYVCRSREFLERWEVGAACEVTLHVKPQSITAYNLKNVQESGLAVEVVS